MTEHDSGIPGASRRGFLHLFGGVAGGLAAQALGCGGAEEGVPSDVGVVTDTEAGTDAFDVGLDGDAADTADAPGDVATVPGPNAVSLVTGSDFVADVGKAIDLLGGIRRFIEPTDVVVIKGNGQWPRQGYTHTGCIKAVVDQILAIPGFAGEVLICDNVQNYGSAGGFGFDATVANRANNWPDHNWNSLAAAYQAGGKPVAAVRWQNRDPPIKGPADGEGWVCDFFDFHGAQAFLAYPIFASPITTGRLIDMKGGVWEKGAYTGRKVKAIFMPNLNNHGSGSEDYAGVTSAIKSFFGATQIVGGAGTAYKGAANIHGASYGRSNAVYAGELAARYMKTMYAPVLFVTAAIYAGWESRTGRAAQTNAVLACTNPATLDYVACKEVLYPAHTAYAFFDPDNPGKSRDQILGCIGGGIGSITAAEMQVLRHTFP